MNPQEVVGHGIAKIVTIKKIQEPDSDYLYWQSQPYTVRLAALEEIRRDYHQWRFGAEPGFQRVLTIVKR
jgi:hypothetical protein